MVDNPYACDEKILLRGVTVERFRSSGPGGQHANKTNSAVRVSHRDSAITCQCQDFREYARNLAAAIRVLRLRLAMHYRGFGDALIFRQRCHGTRLKVSVDAKDMHVLVGYVFDVLADCAWDTRACAETCGLSHSQLCSFLKVQKLVLQTVNAERQRRDLYALK